jgi:hypothetical protein
MRAFKNFLILKYEKFDHVIFVRMKFAGKPRTVHMYLVLKFCIDLRLLALGIKKRRTKIGIQAKV